MSHSENRQVAADDQGRHSPGPWLLKKDINREEYSIRLHPREPGAVGYREVCTVAFGYSEPAESEQHANARLIAAAPDLLEICKAAIYAWDGNGTAVDMDEMRKVVAKAEGR